MLLSSVTPRNSLQVRCQSGRYILHKMGYTPALRPQLESVSVRHNQAGIYATEQEFH